MQYSLPQVCTAVLFLSITLWLACQICLRFYRAYLRSENNKLWLLFEHTAAEVVNITTVTLEVIVRIVQQLVSLRTNLGKLLHCIGLLLIFMGAVCLDLVLIFWGLAALPFFITFTLVLMVLTLVWAIPGLIYGLYRATKDAYDIMCPLTPSHTLRHPRQA